VFESIKQTSFPDDLPDRWIQILEKERSVKVSVIMPRPLNYVVNNLLVNPRERSILGHLLHLQLENLSFDYVFDLLFELLGGIKGIEDLKDLGKRFTLLLLIQVTVSCVSTTIMIKCVHTVQW
jgi:hypothetical protein